MKLLVLILCGICSIMPITSNVWSNIMADIQVNLKISDTENEGISGIVADVANVINNVSKDLADWSASVLDKNDGHNGICIGKWIFGELGTFLPSTGYNGYMFGSTDSDGLYDLELTISGTSVKSMTFIFDRNAEQFATTAILDEGETYEKTIYSDDYIWSIIFDTAETSHTVKFTTWNRADYNACITTIALMPNTLEFTKQWIKSINSNSQSTDNPSGIYYGILASSGEIVLYDVNGEIYDYAVDGYLQADNYPITIKANGNEIQYHLSSDNEYKKNAKTLNIQLTNELENWEYIPYSGRTLTDETTAWDLLVEVFESTGLYDETTDSDITNMCDISIVYGSTTGTVKSYLEAIDIPNPYLESGTLRATIDKFCQLAQLNVVLNDDGEIKFISGRPKATTTEKNNAINILTKNQFSEPEKAVILKNKIDSVEFVEKEASVENQTIVNFNLAMLNEDGGTLPTIALTPNYEILDSESKTAEATDDNFYYYDLYSLKITHSDYVKYSNMKININYSRYTEKYPLETDPIIKYNTTETFDGSNTIILNEYEDFDDFIASFGFEDTPYVPFGLPLKLGLNEDKTTGECELYVCAEKEYNHIFTTYTSEIVTYYFNVTISSDVTTFADNTNTYGTTTKNKYTYYSNELIQTDTVYNSTPITDLIGSNITTDYATGIADGTIKISCADYYKALSYDNVTIEKTGSVFTANYIKCSIETAVANDITVYITMGGITYPYEKYPIVVIPAGQTTVTGTQRVSFTSTIKSWTIKSDNMEIAKTWASGEVIEVGEIIKICKDNNYNSAWLDSSGAETLFKVVGREFDYEGCPYITLTLMEIKQ